MKYKVKINKVYLALLIVSTSFYSALAQDTSLSNQNTIFLSLKRSIEMGLEQNPSVEIYNNNLEKSKLKAKQELSAYLPQVSLQSLWDYNYKLQENVIPAGIFGPEEQRIKFGNKYQTNTIIQLDQTIYDQSLISGLKAGKPNTELAKIEIEKNQETLIYNIANAYYAAIIAQQQMDLLNANVNRFEELMRIVQVQKDNGLANTVDVEQIEVNLKNVTAQIIILENNIELAKNTIKSLLNLPLTTTIELTDSIKSIDNNLLVDNQLAPQEYDYTKTLVYRQFELQKELLDINIKTIRHSALPKLGIYARYGANGFNNDNMLNAWDPLLDFGTIGLKLSWGIFTGFKRQSLYQTAIIDRDNLNYNILLNKNNLALQYENAKTKWLSAKTNIETNRRNMEMAQRVYDITNIRYKEGVNSLVQLLNAEMSVREAYNNYIQTLIEFYRADLEIRKANGTLIQYYTQLK